MAHIEKAKLMHRAWALLRLSMQPFARPAFAACLRQAWAEAKAAPVTPLDRLQRASAGIVAITAGMARDEVIRRLEGALTVARSRAAQYSRAGAPRSSSAGKHRSTDLLRVANLEAILARETAARDACTGRYTARRDGAAFSLRRKGVEFGRLSGPVGALAFSSPNAALTARVKAELKAWDTVPAALAKVRAAAAALHIGGAA